MRHDDDLYRYVGNAPTDYDDQSGEVLTQPGQSGQTLIMPPGTVPPYQGQNPYRGISIRTATQATATINVGPYAISTAFRTTSVTITLIVGNDFYQTSSGEQFSPAEQSMINRAVQAAGVQIWKASMMINSVEDLVARLTRRGTAGGSGRMTRLFIGNPKFVGEWKDFINNMQNKMVNPTINFEIDPVYDSPTEPSLHMTTNPFGMGYPAGAPILVSPSFFTQDPDSQATFMVHEFGRFFGGITAVGGATGDQMETFDMVMDFLVKKYDAQNLPPIVPGPIK